MVLVRMRIELTKFALLAALLPATGCTQTTMASRRNGGAAQTDAYYNQPQHRRMITGSNIPQPVNRPTFDPTFSDTPLESQAREHPGRTPREPCVGAGDQSLYRAQEGSTGASPAGGGSDPGTGQFTPH